MPIKLICAVQKRAAAAPAEFENLQGRNLSGVAGPQHLPSVTKRRVRVMDAAYISSAGATPPRALELETVVEIVFDDFQDMAVALNSSSRSQAFGDLEVFGDDVDKILVLAEEADLPVPFPAVGADSALNPERSVKAIDVMYFLVRGSDVYPEDFQARWQQAHEHALRASDAARLSLQRCQVNRRCRVNDNDRALRTRFPRIGAAVYELVISLRFETSEHTDPFHIYHQVLVRDTACYSDWSQSFCLLIVEPAAHKDDAWRPERFEPGAAGGQAVLVPASQSESRSKSQMNFRDWRTSTRGKSMLPALNVREALRPYAKYYFDEIPEPDSGHLASMESPCDPSRAIYPQQMNDLLNAGDLEIETGWCNLPNGAGFIANRLFYPGVTAEMIDWWFAWHPLEDLRYRIWYPPQHAGAMLSPDGRQRLLDTDIPLAQRNWGVTHHVTEDCNSGMENIDITFLSPQEFGFDMSRWRKPHVATFAGGYGWSVPVDRKDNSITAPALMCHIFRESPAGLEHRTRFWMGYRFSNGKPELTLPPSASVPGSVVRGLALHNVREFTRFRTFLPKIYAECRGPPLA